jgi:rfaE bifunctional protein kinase chain/domain
MESFMLLLERYRHKIKTAQEVRDIVGARPRFRRVVMCHGVFDVSHFGHVVHLVHAKGDLSILVVSLTADRHITKGPHQPHEPQDVRALHLAVLDPVDYVIVDPNPTPIENIRLIEPDVFAKGFEYGSDLSAATTEEAQAVSSYGGDIIFTPGDVVRSSTERIKQAPPDIRLEKLQLLMAQNGVTFDALRGTLDAMKGRKVHVVGDTIVDTITHASLIGASGKTPTMSVQFERKVDYVGGAGVVAKHLAAAGGKVMFSTVLGADDLAGFAARDLEAVGIDVCATIDPSRPTVNKNAIVVGGYRLLKIDTVDNRPISDSIVAELADSIRTESAEAVVFSDFRHGIFNRRTIHLLAQAIPQGCFRAADSQVASRWGNITDFYNFDLITTNEREARFALGDQDCSISDLAANLFNVACCRNLILKLGERGAIASGADRFFTLDSFANHVVDAVGAGDALLAYATLAMVAGQNPVIATILGTMAAAVECERDGNVPVTADDVRARIDAIQRQTP